MASILARVFSASLWSPPCSTFSAARSLGGFGPAPLRSHSGPDRYGYKSLRPREKEEVRLGTLLALRTVEAL
eukprot:11209154-Heterocapsa_arctica.AAC.1